jgi:hypothetical protein
MSGPQGDEAVSRVVLPEGSDAADWRQDPYSIEVAAIEDDTFRLRVSYTGGCEQHSFQLVASESFSRTGSIEVGLLLSHNAKGDPCKALITQELRFDLSPLKRECQRTARTRKGPILLHLQNLDLRYHCGATQ